jgi:hypothetical protein
MKARRYYAVGLGLALLISVIAVSVSAELISAEPDWFNDGEEQGALYAYAVAGIGDVNNDGFDDIAVGAPLDDAVTYRGGAVYVHYGSPSGYKNEPDWVAGGDQLGARFGHAVTGAGDVNHDSYDDLIIGAYHYNDGDPEVGRVFVYHGSADGLSTSANWIATGASANARFGWSVAGARDIDADGYDDVVIGSPLYDADVVNGGMAMVYRGGAAGLDSDAAWVIPGTQQAAQLGYAVDAAGDVNADGYDDIVLGAPFANGTGQVHLFLGHATQTPLSAWLFDGLVTDSQFGRSVAAAGDVNADGYADFIVGAPDYSNGQEGEGGAWLYCGGADSAEICWHDDGDLIGAQFGYAVAGSGDVNADGYDDILIGLPGHTGDQPHEGRAYVYFGYGGGVFPWPGWQAEGNKSEAGLGFTVDGVLHANADGYADLLIGAPDYRHGEIIVGRATAYLGHALEPAKHVLLPCVVR